MRMHTHEYVGDMIHIPTVEFTLFHRSTVGGGNTPGHVAIQQQRQRKEELLASKCECK